MRLLIHATLVCALTSPVLAAEGNGPEFHAPAPGRVVANAERAGGGQAYQDTQGGVAMIADSVRILQAGDGPLTLSAPDVSRDLPIGIADAR